MEAKKKSWTSALFAYAEGEKKQLILSVILSVLSVMLGLVPFYCIYALICLFVAGTATAALAVKWCLLALLAYAVKILLFSLSTGTSHAMAYTILEGLRLRLADRFLHAPLGNMENHTIGEIKSMMMDKIENLERYCASTGGWRLSVAHSLYGSEFSHSTTNTVFSLSSMKS